MFNIARIVIMVSALACASALACQDDAHAPPARAMPIESEATLPTPVSSEALPLGAPATPDLDAGASARSSAGSALGELLALGLPLAGVLGIIIGLAALLRRVARARGGILPFGTAAPAPSGVVEVLARYPLARGQALLLVRVHRRVLLLCSAGGRADTPASTLAEFSGADEVASLLHAVSEGERSTLAHRFTHALEREQSTQKGDGAPIPRAARPAQGLPVSPTGGVMGGPSAVQSLRAQIARLQHDNRGRAA